MTDIICLLIILASAIWYGWKGFAVSIMSMLQWFVTIVTSLFFCDNLSKYLSGTSLKGSLNSYFKEKFGEGLSDNPVARTLPEVFNGWVNKNTDYVTEIAAEDLTRVVLIIMSFFILVVLVKVLCWLFTRLFSKEHNSGFFGLIDKILGCGLGIVLGFLYVLLFCTLLLPMLEFFSEDMSQSIMHSMERSFFSGSLFDNNFLIKLMRGLFS